MQRTYSFMNNRHWQVRIYGVIAAMTLLGCSGENITSPRIPDGSTVIASFDHATTLDARRLTLLQQDPQGCAIGSRDALGRQHALGVMGSGLPFQLPAIQRGEQPSVPGRNATVRFQIGSNGIPVDVRCVVPRNLGDAAFARVVSASQDDFRWLAILSRLAHSEPLDITRAQNISNEAKEVRFKTVGNNQAGTAEEDDAERISQGLSTATSSVVASPVGTGPITSNEEIPQLTTVQVMAMVPEIDWFSFLSMMNLYTNPLGGEATGTIGGYGSGLPAQDEDPAAAFSGPCHTGDPIIDSQAIQNAMKSIWQQSHAGEDDQELRREIGGWILQNPDGSYAFQPFANPLSLPCGLNINENPPSATVAWIHTHPWALGEPQLSCDQISITYQGVTYSQPVNYNGQSSQPDDDVARQIGKPGYLIDKNGIGKFFGDGGTHRNSRCAY